MNSIRLSSLLLLCVGMCGCQQLALSPKPRKDSAQQAGERVPIGENITLIDNETRDEDSFASRLAITGKEAGEATSKALNPASWKADPNSPAERQRRAAIRRKQKLKQSQPNAFMRFFFPEPKPPRTVGEWLAQDRLDK